MSQPKINPEQRDLLYLLATARLTGVGDVYHEFQHGNFEAAQELSGEFSDVLRVLHDDLGWVDSPLESIELRAPRDIWERTLTRTQERARIDLRRHEERTREADGDRQRAQELLETCAELAKQFHSE